MILEFIDGSQISVNNIFGSMRLIFGSMRDTLAIEVDPLLYTFDDLRSHFKDNPKTAFLYTRDQNGNRIDLGEGYKIFVSMENEIREVKRDPGNIGVLQLEEVNIITIAQLTYQERLLENAGVGIQTVFATIGDPE